jgi:hypothetical protein
MRPSHLRPGGRLEVPECFPTEAVWREDVPVTFAQLPKRGGHLPATLIALATPPMLVRDEVRMRVHGHG